MYLVNPDSYDLHQRQVNPEQLVDRLKKDEYFVTTLDKIRSLMEKRGQGESIPDEAIAVAIEFIRVYVEHRFGYCPVDVKTKVYELIVSGSTEEKTA